MYLVEKIHVSENLYSGRSYSAIGCEFNVNESTIYINSGVFKQRHT